MRTMVSRSSKALALALALASGSMLNAQPGSGGTIAEDGTLIPAQYSLPLSDFSSEEFKREYLKLLRGSAQWPHPPAMDAPKAEWDKYDADTDRLQFGDTLDWTRKTFPVDIVDTHLGGVHVAIVTPRGGVKPGQEHMALIQVHGGGFFMGRGLTLGLIEAIPIASMSGMKVIAVDYRMAPYHQFPAASEDIEAVYRELLKTHKPEGIGMFGCSAGGSLTSQSVAWMRSKGLPAFGAVGIFCSAPVRPGLRGDSGMWTTTGLPWPTAFRSETKGGGGYMATADRNDPRAYPGISDEELASFPPTLLMTGTRAPETSAAVTAHAKFLKLGVDSQLYLIEGGHHGSGIDAEVTSPEANDVRQYIARWFGQKLSK